MPHNSTPTFIVEIPLETSRSDDRELGIRREAYRQIGNAVNGESLKTLDLMRESKAYRAACKLPKGSNENETEKAKKKLRSDTFKHLNEKYGFTSRHAEIFAAKCCQNAPHIGDHTESHGVRGIVHRAFEAVQKYAFGKIGRPKFKGLKELNSVEGTGDSAIMLRKHGDGLVIKWNGLVMPVILDLKNDWQIKALTEYRTKYVRIVWKEVNGKTRIYAQLAQEGFSPPKRGNQHKIGTEVVGIDLGTSTVAIVGETQAILTDLCPTVKIPAQQIRLLQRKMDRSIRKSNPDAFNQDGTWKKGTKRAKLVRTKTYQKIRTKKTDIERKLAAERKRSHGELANKILSIGNQIKTEAVSVKGWSRGLFGKSISKKAPAMLMSMIEQKVKATKDGSYVKFSTQKTKLSQFDHKTGLCTKKSLSKREHVFSDGSRVQRDLYSAYLARFVFDDRLDVSQCVKHWAGAESLLRIAALSHTQGASGETKVNPTLLSVHDPLGSEAVDGVRVSATEISIGSCHEVAEVVAAVVEMQRTVRAAKSARLQNARLTRELGSGSDEETSTTVKVG